MPQMLHDGLCRCTILHSVWDADATEPRAAEKRHTRCRSSTSSTRWIKPDAWTFNEARFQDSNRRHHRHTEPRAPRTSPRNPRLRVFARAHALYHCLMRTATEDYRPYVSGTTNEYRRERGAPTREQMSQRTRVTETVWLVS